MNNNLPPFPYYVLLTLFILAVACTWFALVVGAFVFVEDIINAWRM